MVLRSLAAKAKTPPAKRADDSLKAEGKGDQVKSDLKQTGEKVRNAFKKH
jgi:hypothetical protein